MIDKKKSFDDVEPSEETRRKKAHKKRKQRDIEETEFADMLDEMLEDENLYQILKKLKD